MTQEFFAAQMARLMGLRFSPADLDTHWEALQDIPEAVLEAAVTLAQRTRVDFPTPVELRQDADAARVVTVAPDEDRGRELPAPVVIGTTPAGTPIRQTREWRYYCDECADTGVRSLWCGEAPSARAPWMPLRRCDSASCRKVQYAHEWVEHCACWDTNPALIRKREAQRKYAEKPGKAA